MPDLNVADLAMTIVGFIFLGILFGKSLRLMDAATDYLRSRTEIDRDKYNHDRINGKI